MYFKYLKKTRKGIKFRHLFVEYFGSPGFKPGLPLSFAVVVPGVRNYLQ